MQTKNSLSGAGGAHIGFAGRPRIFMNAADKGGAGGQPGPGGQPGQGGEGGEGGGAKSAMSDDLKREVGEMINAHVSGAMNNHLTRFKKTFTEEITGTLTNTLGPIGEQLKALTERQTQAPKGKEGADAAASEAIRTMELKYEQRIKELEQANRQEKEAREQEKSARLRDEERTTLASALRNRGLGDAQIKGAVAVLHTEDKRVARTEDGRIVFRFERGSGNGRYVDELDLEKGVEEWLKTDEGKGYIPPRPAQGAGGQPARQPGQPPRNAAEAKSQAAAQLAGMLLGNPNNPQ